MEEVTNKEEVINKEEVVNNQEPQQQAQGDQNADDQGHKSKKGRIIIRNLVYDIHETHLRKLFQKYGTIYDIQLPVNPATNKTKGFAFVELENKIVALKAIKELNETKFKGRAILLDLAVEKTRYEATKQPQQKEQKEQKQKKEQPANVISSSARLDEDDDFEQEKQESENEMDEDIGDEEEEDDDEDFEDEEEEEQEQEKQPRKKSKVKEEKQEDLSSTIFVRNISYEVGQSEFKQYFAKFGKIYYAKLVINRETESHNGTGFVKFKSPIHAKKLVEESKKQENGEMSEIDFELGGRRIIVLPALAKKEVETLKETKNQSKTEHGPKNQNTFEYWIYHDKEKKRNCYLVTYGLNEPDETFSEADKKKFEDNKIEKIQKLKNPNYKISTTRVIFKNLPKREFDEPDLRNVILTILGEKYNQKILKTRRLVSKATIIREKDRTEEDGTPKSKGYGFAEFVSQEDALFFLQKIKEKYNLISERKIPIVEFAIEDVRELKKKEKLLQKLQQSNKRDTVKKSDEEKKEKKENPEKKNAENLAKLQLTQLLEQKGTGQEALPQIEVLMRKIKSRGLKQRFKKKIAQKFPNLHKKNKQQNEENSGLSKLEKKKNKKREERKQKKERREPQEEEQQQPKRRQNENNEMNEEENEAVLIKQIKRMIKNNKRNKRRAEDHDEFDEMADAYQKKVQKVSS